MEQPPFKNANSSLPPLTVLLSSHFFSAAETVPISSKQNKGCGFRLLWNYCFGGNVLGTPVSKNCEIIFPKVSKYGGQISRWEIFETKP
jgi:hypothetical protein